METTQRLFFALWPNQNVRSALAALSRATATTDCRPVRPENIHLTLAFLGSLVRAQRECLEQAVDAIATPTFELHLDRLGCWPRPRILWVGTSATPSTLLRLVDALKEALRRCGLQPEERPFQTHVTLARKFSGRRVTQPIDPILWKAAELCLVESRTLPQGVRYEVVGRWRLRETAPATPA
jgi:2'-5' RNA ligase